MTVRRELRDGRTGHHVDQTVDLPGGLRRRLGELAEDGEGGMAAAADGHDGSEDRGVAALVRHRHVGGGGVGLRRRGGSEPGGFVGDHLRPLGQLGIHGDVRHRRRVVVLDGRLELRNQLAGHGLGLGGGDDVAAREGDRGRRPDCRAARHGQRGQGGAQDAQADGNPPCAAGRGDPPDASAQRSGGTGAPHSGGAGAEQTIPTHRPRGRGRRQERGGRGLCQG